MIKNGLIIGKFHPLHKGHLALIEFAAGQCQQLLVVICAEKSEKFNSEIRRKWVARETADLPNLLIDVLEYDKEELPNTSTSSRQVSETWSRVLKLRYPNVQAIFSSEKYGDYVAQYMGIQHFVFDIQRLKIPVAASQIFSDIKGCWRYLPESVKEDLVTKICLIGTESTGKSTLTIMLAEEFNCDFVPEVARDIIPTTREANYSDLIKVSMEHANAIIRCSQLSKAPLLFIDTDVSITKSYSQYLFNKELEVEPWIVAANKMHQYFYLLPDCEFVQDGTRLTDEERLKLHESHLAFQKNGNKDIVFVGGTWDKRFSDIKDYIKQNYSHVI
jgi:HTH-type transcriptional repressor of NAD biosynthesis genes